METSAYFPFWNQLSAQQKEILENGISIRQAKKGSVIHNGSEDCTGLLLVTKGQLRAYILSEEGKEITLYRLFERDMCLFSASCIMRSIQFEIMVQAAQDVQYLHIPSKIYEKLMVESAAVSNYTNEIMASRFSDIMWLLDQILYKKMDSRIAAFLLEEFSAMGKDIPITHDEIARNLGTAREVVTRMLRYFQQEGILSLSRGSVRIWDPDRLKTAAAESIR